MGKIAEMNDMLSFGQLERGERIEVGQVVLALRRN